MKIGLYMATQWPQGADLTPRIADLSAQVRAAKANGFASVFVGQHFLVGPSMQMVQMAPLLARLAAEGEGMTFGSAIVLLGMLNPVQVAEDYASIDWLCGGRFVLGVGIGYRRAEFAALGMSFADRAERYEEAIDLVRRLWREDRVNHAGNHFQIDGLGSSIRPQQPDGPPIWLAGEVPPAVRRAARLGDAWVPPPIPTLDGLPRLLPPYRQARAEAGLADPVTQPLIRECCIGPSKQAALATARPTLQAKYEAYASWGQAESANSDISGNFEGFAADRFLIGDEAEVADELARYGETLGVDHMLLRLQWPGLPQEAVIAAIERIGRVIAKLN